jgi:hypothetical protein
MSATVITGGSLGSTYTLALASEPDTQFTGTLTANCAFTVTGLTAGCAAVMLLTQNATGGWTITIDGAAVSITTAAGAFASVKLWSPDGSTLYVEPGPQTGPPGPVMASHAFSIYGAYTLPNLGAGDVAKIDLPYNLNFGNADGWWDETNYRWVPQVAGYYLFVCYFVADVALSTADFVDLAVFKNGTGSGGDEADRWTNAVAGIGAQFSTTALWNMNGSTDYVEAWGNSTMASNTGYVVLSGTYQGS